MPRLRSRLRWWWRAWQAWFGLALVWIAGCAWLHRPLAPWATRPAGWWTGDDSRVLPAKRLLALPPDQRGVLSLVGNPAFVLGAAASIELGHLERNQNALSLSAWVQVTEPEASPSDEFLVLQDISSEAVRIRVGLREGHPCVHVAGDLSRRPRPAPVEFISRVLIPQGRWFHLGLATDGRVLSLYLDGRPVLEEFTQGWIHASLELAMIRLRNAGLTADGIVIPPRRARFLAQDDIVAFDRLLSPDEMSVLAHQPRGGWVREATRRERASRLWNVGWPVILTTMGLLLLVQGATRTTGRLAQLGVAMRLPAYRSVRWTILLGCGFTMVATVLVHRSGRDGDRARFHDLVQVLRGEMDGYWENKVVPLLGRARDWIASHPDATLDSWEFWLKANGFPHEFPGVLGVGFAERVLPSDLTSHAQAWAGRHRFDYRVHPADDVPRRLPRELEGDPRLPVVLYAASQLPRERWLTNHTILGRDLLHLSPADPRTWAEGRRVEEAVARNELTPSSVETIAPAGWYGPPILGLRLFAPWTLRDKGSAPRLAPTDWKGVVFASVDFDEIIRGRFGAGPSLLGFRIATGSPDGYRYDELADTGRLIDGAAEPANPYWRATIEYPFYHHRLFLDLWTTPTFDAQSTRAWPWIVALGGAAWSGLAAAMLLVQVIARERQSRVLDALCLANSELVHAYREREQLARDVHDGSIQNLYALGLHLRRIEGLLDTRASDAREGLGESRRLLDHSITELREFILSASPDPLRGATLSSAMKSLAERLARGASVDYSLSLDPAADQLAPVIAIELLNVVRESMSNALRHASPSRIDIHLERRDPDSSWRLVVADDGRGFHPEPTRPAGRGLKNLSARAAELGGTLRIESSPRPGSGTVLSLDFPSPATVS